MLVIEISSVISFFMNHSHNMALLITSAFCLPENTYIPFDQLKLSKTNLYHFMLNIKIT